MQGAAIQAGQVNQTNVVGQLQCLEVGLIVGRSDMVSHRADQADATTGAIVKRAIFIGQGHQVFDVAGVGEFVFGQERVGVDR